MSQLERISISIDPDLLARLDGLVAQAGHGNRSEAVRDLIRGQLVGLAGPETIVIATLTITFSRARRDLTAQLVDAASQNHEQVLACMQVHLDAERHLQVMALRGPRSGLEGLAAQVIGMKGVTGGQLVIVDTED